MMSEPTASRDFDELVSWAESHGGYCCPALAFSKSEKSGSTAYAKGAIPDANTRLLSCPVSLIIDYDKAATQIWGDRQSCPFAGSPQIAIRLFLCMQRILGRQSPWSAYISLLPTQFDTPLYYDHEEMEMLRGTNIFGEVELRRQAWMEEWKRGVMYLPSQFDKSLVSWDMYMWACTVLSSRSFPSRIVFNTGSDDDEDSYPVLIPLVDSLNHKPLEPINWTVTPDEFSISSGKDIGAGDEIFNNYGPKGNEELLMGYGFCLENNPLDVVTLKVRHPLMSMEKVELLSLKGNAESTFHLSESEPLPSDLVQFFRVIAANEQETLQMLSASAGATATATLRCELDGLGKLYNAVELKLRAISVREDETANASARQRNSMIYVSQQAKILSRALLAIVRAMYSELGIQQEAAEDCPGGSSTQDLAYIRSRFYQHLPEYGFNLELVLNPGGRFSEFASVIKQGFDVTSASDVRAADIEDQVLVLFVCHLLISGATAGGDYANWLRSMQQRYNTDEVLDEEFVEDFESMYDAYIPVLAELHSDMFGSAQWSARLLAWAGKVVDHEGVVVQNCEDDRPEYWIIAV
ncbi:hypothetical protein V1525DRAFT_407467 [Lipomyces kononenkoae]|uniref:Uncharacterized protein n=1 Tax=Lipomyces kononenkoae TaxID=34357 RepID=A0ACC3SYM4_LIPKO